MDEPEAAQGGRDPHASGFTPLEALIARTRTCCLRPFRFFVSWQGVLTLAYTGSPPALMQLKHDIGDIAGPALKAENPGSRWPKTTLAALRDRARLTPEQLQQLNGICREESAPLAADDERLRVWVDHAAIAVYACRSLERVLSCRDVPFTAGPPDSAEPLQPDHQRVLTILAEADDDDYWFAASRDGNREAHYRGPHVGATLMHKPEAFRVDQPASQLAMLVRRFQERVERELPSIYKTSGDTGIRPAPALHMMTGFARALRSCVASASHQEGGAHRVHLRRSSRPPSRRSWPVATLSIPRPGAAVSRSSVQSAAEDFEFPDGHVRYETMIVLRPDMTDEERDSELAKFEAFLSKLGGSNTRAMVRGRQRLAYPISKFWEGIYVLYDYSAPRTASQQVQKYLSTPIAGNELNILRHMTFNR